MSYGFGQCVNITENFDPYFIDMICDGLYDVVQDVFEMKYAHTPMDAPSSSLPPRTEPDLTKTSASAASQGRKDVAGDGGEESEEERERRLHELQQQVSVP